jgi:intracellular sulfur oxidation DsrE/DsrF family protein
MTAHPSDDRGAVGLLTMVSALMVTTLALAVVLTAAAVGVTAAQARTAADAAALAAMGASPLVGGNSTPEREAERVAAANGATIVNLDTNRWPSQVTVEIQIQPPPLLRPANPPPLRAHATAAAHPTHTP